MTDFALSLTQTTLGVVFDDGQLVLLVGTPGPRGAPGTGATDLDALHVSQRLAEFGTDTARQQARANIGVDVIDLGTFN